MYLRTDAAFLVIILAAAATFADQSVGSSDEAESYPEFLGTNTNVTVGPGDRAVLKCKVENIGTKTITWRRRGEQHPLTVGRYTFVADSRISVDYKKSRSDTSEWSLIIQDIQPTDEGIYLCQITTMHQPRNSYDIQLNVHTVQVTGTGIVMRGDQVQLTCNATGKPEPPHNVVWYKDGEQITSDGGNGIIITKKIGARVLVSMLVIKRSRDEDAGEYMCLSSNSDAKSFPVIVVRRQSGDEIREQPDVGKRTSVGTYVSDTRAVMTGGGCPPIYHSLFPVLVVASLTALYLL